MLPVTRSLASFVCTAPSASASARTSEVVRAAVLDLLGVTVLGVSEDASRLVLDYARAQGATGPSAVVGMSVRLAPSMAALVNGTAGHALDFDDIGLGAGHISVAILPAVWAVAEYVKADGAAFIDALVIAYEIAHRLTTMYPDTRLGPYASGYHKPSVYGSLGATAGCARLLGLTAEGVAHAFGIAASQSGGLRANFGTMTKPLHAGIANRTGVEAAFLARSGFTSSPEIIEQRFGWHDVICRGEGSLDVVIGGLAAVGLSAPFAIEEGLTFKAYPCCGANHYAIDGVITAMRAAGLSESDVASIDVWIDPRSLNDVLVYPWPRTPLEGKFCLAYNVAAALADGTVSVQTFTEATLARLASYRERVSVHTDASLAAMTARVRVITTGGRTVEHEQVTLRGTIANPMSWDELEAKFRANVKGLVADSAAGEAIARIATLEDQKNLTEISELLEER